MHYLVQPRGAGTGWVFRMITPPSLIGRPNPWTGKPFGKEIKKGLQSRQLVEARKRRDVALGEVRQCVHLLTEEGRHSTEVALEWHKQIQREQNSEDPIIRAHGSPASLVLTERLAQSFPERNVRLPPRATRFAKVAFGDGFPLDTAVEQYIRERSPNNSFGYAPLATTTVLNLHSAVKHLKAFTGSDDMTACLEDITIDEAQGFRDDYLPTLTSHRSPNGLSSSTINKQITLLRGLWRWAIERRFTRKGYTDPWSFARSTPRAKRASQADRSYFNPQQVALLFAASPIGTREGDILRLALATGCRADELASLSAMDVLEGGAAFQLLKGKTANAQRYIPLVAEAAAQTRSASSC